MADDCADVREQLTKLRAELAKTEEFLPAGPKVKERVNPAWTRLMRRIEIAEGELAACREAAQPLAAMKAFVRLDEVRCRDENDGSGSAEPYLWRVFFKIDGETVSAQLEGDPQQDDGANARLRIAGKATVLTHSTNHKNLTNDGVSAPRTVAIPRELGLYETTLVPVSVAHPLFGSMPIMPGFIGCVAVLLEQDNTVNGPIAKGHRALNAAVQRVIDELIARVGAEVAKVSVKSLLKDPGRVKNTVLRLVNDALVTRQADVQNEVKRAIKDDVDVWKWLAGVGDMDDLVGMLAVVYSQQQLALGGKYIVGRFRVEGEWELWGAAGVVPLSETSGGVVTTPANPERMNAVWRKASQSRPAAWSYQRADFERREAAERKHGYQLSRLNGFVHADGNEYYNAVWEVASAWRPALWSYKRGDFDKRAAEYARSGYQLRDLNTFVLRDGSERFNAIWEKSATNTASVWSYGRADFDVRARELASAGFALRCVNAFVLPGQGARFNAIWDKSGADRLAVWDWQRADFDRRERELRAQGYRLIDLNAYVPAPGAGELYNAVWERMPVDLATVWAWQRSDFDERARELADAGFQLDVLSTFLVG